MKVDCGYLETGERWNCFVYSQQFEEERDSFSSANICFPIANCFVKEVYDVL